MATKKVNIDIVARDKSQQALNKVRGSLDKVKAGTNIFDATKIKFSPKDTSSFNINKFMRNLGISDITDDVAKEKMTTILGGPAQAKQFEKFLTNQYMKT